ASGPRSTPSAAASPCATPPCPRPRENPEARLSPAARPVRGRDVTAPMAREITMDARIDYVGNLIGAKVAKYIVSASKAVADSTLPAATRELVQLRTSQINGCAVCVDMHTKDAAL